ncbi:hypothetical protein DL764_005856 [Monosporascus ibericus]|uniref:CBM6 domain-containing protein n=1 Tax=Monosporascus ibericus TaxID=155417 RepID=A0A4Q4TAA0_9PEZI|nr:hypothetical protein DL764_005856 [Monosporascus ibericus]
MRFLRSTLLTLAVALAASSAEASLQIVPGGSWTTSNGTHLQAHGPGVVFEGGTYYLIGEDKTQGTAFQNINCYSSRDLVQWTYEGALLSRTSSGDLGPNRVVERPKVMRNPRTGKYVLFLHIDSSDYGEAEVGIAVGDSVCGRYEYRGSFRPLGRQSRDMGVFLDPDTQVGYLLTEDRENGLRILRLSDDFLQVEADVFLWRLSGGDRVESPALVKTGGRYYMLGSRLTGWDPNDNVYTTSTRLDGGWSAWRGFARAGSRTYDSQTSFVLPVVGNGGRAFFVYLGDRWVRTNLAASTYVWLPLDISGETVSMSDYVSWVPDVAAGSWTGPPAETQYEGEAAAYGGAARDVSCGGCSGGRAAGYLGGPDGGSVTFRGVRSDVTGRTTIRVKYLNGDSAPRYAAVRVNGGAPQTLAFVQATGNPSSSVLHADLRAGGDNTIVIEGLGDGSWGPDVDRLMVPRS